MSEKIVEQPLNDQNRPMSDLRGQLAAYLAMQPLSVRARDRRMKIVEAAGMAVLLALFAGALYVSISWRTVSAETIAAAWFIFVVATCVVFSLVGFHAALIKAFPPLYLPGNRSSFVTGQPAVNRGLGAALAALLWGALWGAFGYFAIGRQWDFLNVAIPIVAVVAGLVIGVLLLVSVYRAVTR